MGHPWGSSFPSLLPCVLFHKTEVRRRDASVESILQKNSTSKYGDSSTGEDIPGEEHPSRLLLRKRVKEVHIPIDTILLSSDWGPMK